MKLALNLSFLAALATAACGCAGPTGPDVEFPAEGTVRAPQRVAEVQASQGARADANFYAVHFTDDALNSLGRAKLDAMIRDDESVRPVTIHLASVADSAAQMRRIESITAYLKDAGLNESQMRFETGLNGESYHPSAPDLANLSKTDSAEPGAGVGAGPAGGPAVSTGQGPGYMAR
jgi:hypothetical protein